MSRENVVISLDGHPHAFIDLKPWLPQRFHAGFDEATELGITTFKGANKYFADLAAAGHAFNFESADDLRAVDWRQYNEAMSCEERLAKIDADGVAAELLIDSFGPITGDPVLNHEITLAFCRWYSDYVSPAPYRFAGAVVTAFAAGPEVVVQEIDAAYRAGLKAVHLPPAPRVARPDLPDYNHPMYEPIWQALNERGMAMLWHSSVGREKPGWLWSGDAPGWESLLFVDIEEMHKSVLAYLLLSGVPERYPDLRFGFVESGSTWIAPILEKLDVYMPVASRNGSYRLGMSPSEQWRRQGFASGPLQSEEIAGRHRLGVETLCFGSDFIHTESSYPNSRRHLESLLSDVPDRERAAIVRDNAVRLFGFDVDRLAQVPAARHGRALLESSQA